MSTFDPDALVQQIAELICDHRVGFASDPPPPTGEVIRWVHAWACGSARDFVVSNETIRPVDKRRISLGSPVAKALTELFGQPGNVPEEFATWCALHLGAAG